MSANGVARAALAAGLAVHAVFATVALARSAEPADDFDRYYEIATGPGRPYIDYQVEHPIGTWLVFKSFTAIPGGRASFGRSVVLANAAADAAIVGALLWTWGVPAAAYYVLVASPIAGLLFNRIDFWSLAAGTLAVAAWWHRRVRSALIALAAGVLLKIWPLVFAAAFVSDRRLNARAIVRAVGIAVVAAAAILLVADARAIVDVITFRHARGWQIESIVGSLVHAVGREPPRMESGSWRVGSMSELTAVVLFAIAAPVSLWCSWRGFRRRLIGTGWLASLSWLLALSALFSAQYIAWLIPGGAIAWTEGNRRSASLAACCVVLTQMFWSCYEQVVGGVTFAMLLVIVRNAMVLALAIDATAALAAGSRLQANLQPQLTAEGVVERAEQW